MPEKFDIYSKIFYMDVEKIFRHLCRLVMRHQMPVWNYFVNSFYSAALPKFCVCEPMCFSPTLMSPKKVRH